MKILKFVFIFVVGLPMPGHADISDSGSLNLNGQAIVGGTMTVSGNAFSVNTSTVFTIVGGRVGMGMIPNTSMRLFIDSNNDNWGFIRFASGTANSGQTIGNITSIVSGSNDFAIVGGPGHPISLSANNAAIANQLFLANNGNVGIGTTNPAIKFQVVESAEAWTADFKNYATNAYGLRIDLSGSSGTRYVLGAYSATGTGMFLQNDGKLGIGTTSPSYQLDVNGTGRLSGLFYAAPNVGIQLNTGNEGLYAASASSNVYLFANSGWVNVQNLWALHSGNVGVGTSSPGYLLDVSGAAHASSFPTSSDMQLKENIKPLTGVLDRLKGIHGVSFDWNEKYKKMGRATPGRQIGLIAQEVETEFPELISKWKSPESFIKRKSKSGVEEQIAVGKWSEYRGMDYGRFTAVLLEAIKEQQKQIDDLKIQIQDFKKSK